jgi:hypothetical protein
MHLRKTIRKIFLIILPYLIFISCSTITSEEFIRNKINNFNTGDNIQKVIHYFEQNKINYDLWENINENNYSNIINYCDETDKVIFSIYYIKKNNTPIIKETYYMVYIIFNNENKLKEIIFDKAFLSI